MYSLYPEVISIFNVLIYNVCLKSCTEVFTNYICNNQTFKCFNIYVCFLYRFQNV